MANGSATATFAGSTMMPIAVPILSPALPLCCRTGRALAVDLLLPPILHDAWFEVEGLPVGDWLCPGSHIAVRPV